MPPSNKKSGGPESEFSDSDRATLDQIIRDRDRRAWLIELVKRWAQWIAAVVLAAKFGWDALAEIVSRLSK